MTWMDTVIGSVIRSNFNDAANEQQYWENNWERQLAQFDQDGAPWEETVPWERACDAEMARAYDQLFGSVAGKTVLELGAGGGHISCKLAQLGAQVTLVDFSPKALEYAGRTAAHLGVSDRVTLIQADLFDTDLTPHDFCFNCGVLEHYEDEDATRMLQTMARLGTQGAAVTVPNLISPELVYRMLRFGKGSERYMTPRSVGRLVTAAGLENVAWEPVDHWTPSFLGAAPARLARDLRLVRFHWSLSWLFTCMFKSAAPSQH